MGGGKMTQSKADELLPNDLDVEAIHGCYGLLQGTLLRFGPVLYVGQAKCIRTRASQHAEQNSPLRKRLETLGLDIEDMALHYLPMPGSGRAEREGLEQILTHLLVAPLTYRPG